MVAQPDAVAWEASLDRARARAREEGKALLLDFRVAFDPPAYPAVDRMVYPHPGVASFIRLHFVPVRVRVEARPGTTTLGGGTRAPIILVGGGGRGAHYRVDGSLPADDFVAQLGLGLGRYRFDRQEFAEAIHRFEEVANRHEGTQAAGQAYFWLGLARYKQSTLGRSPSPEARKSQRTRP